MRAVVLTLALAAALVPVPALAQEANTLGFLAYSRDPDIYVAKRDGSEEQKVATGFAPSLNADGTLLAYSVRTGGAAQLLVTSLDVATPPKQVTTFGNREPEFGEGRYGAFGSAWSPDSKLLAMRLQEGSTTTLAIVGADGTGFRRFDFGHLLGSGIAWRNGSEVAVGTDSGLRLVTASGSVSTPPGAGPTDTPVAWIDTGHLAVNAPEGFVSLDVGDGTRTTMAPSGTGWGISLTGDIVFSNDTSLLAIDFTTRQEKELAPLPGGAQVRNVLVGVDPVIVEMADATGNSTAIHAVEDGALRKVADGDNVTVTRLGVFDQVVPSGGATATPLPGATALPDLGSVDTADLLHAQGRSTFAAAVPAADSVETGVRALVTSVLLTALLMLLVTFPAELFNNTLEEHYDEVRGWFRLKPRAPVAGQPRGRRLAVFGGCLLVAAFLYSLLDPAFGLDGPSLRLYVGLLLGMVVVTAVFSAAPLAYLRRRYDERGLLRAFPGALAVGAACVLVSRLASFEPGYVYGILGGFAFSRAFSKEEEGRNALVSAGSVLAVAILAWLVWQPVNDAASDGRPSFLLGLGDSTLATVAVGGIQGLVIGLLPLRSMQGYALSRWNRRVWIALYGVVLFLFVHLLLRQGGDETGPPFVTWLALFLGFGALSVAFWGYFRLRPSSARTAPP